MKLVALVLTLGLCSAGCAIQAGEPTSEGNQRSENAATDTAAQKPIKTLAPTHEPAALPANPSGISGQGTTTPGGSSQSAAAPVGTPGMPPVGDNPNPSPWGNGQSNGNTATPVKGQTE